MLIQVRHPVAHMNYTAYQMSRFGDRVVEQERVAEVLAFSLVFELERLGRRMMGCCRDAMVAVDDETGKARLHEKRCKSRFCVYCGRFHARRVFFRLLACLAKMDDFRFLTLTVASSDLPLHQQLKHLRESFARLRRSRPWKQHVVGGAYTIEVSFNRKTGRWHPHIHALIDGVFWQQSEISDAWGVASGGSRVVDIRRVAGKRGAARYLASYAGKGSDLRAFPTDRVVEFVEAARDLRMIQTFGTLHGVTEDRDDEPDTSGWVELFRAEELASRARDGDGFGRALLDYILAGAPDRVPDGGFGPLAAVASGEQTIAGVVRNWWAQLEDERRERVRATQVAASRRRADNRGFWDREIAAAPAGP